MSIQSGLQNYVDGTGPRIQDPPERPDDDNLEHVIAPNCLYDNFDVNQVAGIHELRQQIREAVFAANSIDHWSHILGDHLTMGNEKLADSIAIYNFGGAAHDCINLGTSHCQVPADECYAVRAENNFPAPIHARRRELIIWDHLDAATFAKAFRTWYGRRHRDVTALRFSESGDFRSRHDLYKADEIARRLDDIVDVFTYSASDFLPWNDVEHLVVNRSNDEWAFGDRRFEVVNHIADIPDHGIRCPHDASGGDIKCGDCRLCLDPGTGPHIYVKNFYTPDEKPDDSGGNHT